MQPPTLPLELYHAVIKHVDDNPTILSLLAVSRAISEETERVLYRSVTLDGVNLDRDARILTAVAGCERLARHVHYLHIRHQQYSLFQTDTGYAQRLDAALRALVNLTVLTSDRHFIPPPPAACTFQLTAFKWGVLSRKLDLGAFLARQPRIRLLEISWDAHAPPPPEMCPALDALAGPTATLAAFLPGRAVRRVRWHQTAHHDEPITPADADALAVPLRRVRALVLTSMYGDVPLPALAPHLASLQYLELNGNGVEHLELIKRFSLLRGLMLRPSAMTLGEDFSTEVVAALFTALGELRFIETTDYSRSMLLRWERGAAKPRAVLKQHNWLNDIA